MTRTRPVGRRSRRLAMTMGLILAVALQTACFDESIEVVFDIPNLDSITEVHFAVYAQAQTPLSCDDLAFGDIDLAVLESAQVFSAVLAPGQRGSIQSIPRLGKKLFFAEAFISTGVSVYAGCAEHGEIDGPTQVEIPAESRKNSALTAPLKVSGPGGGNHIGDIDLAIFDLTGSLVSGEPVRYTVIGASAPSTDGFHEDGEAITQMGRARFTPATPPAAGPFEINIRIRWAQSPLPPISGFLSPAPISAPVNGDVNVGRVDRGSDLLEVGRVGPGGALRIVMLAKEQDGATQLYRFALDANQPSLIADPPIEVGRDVPNDRRGAQTLGKLESEDYDEIIAVWKAEGPPLQWTSLSPGQTRTIATEFDRLPIKLRGLSNCVSANERLLFAQLEENTNNDFSIRTARANGKITSLRLTAQALSLARGSQLVELGCARNTLNKFQTTFVFDQKIDPGSDRVSAFKPSIRTLDFNSDGSTRLRFGSMTINATAVWIGPFEKNAAGTMLVGETTLVGPAVSRYQVQPVGESLVSADLQAMEPMPATVIATAEGDINGDGKSDVVSLVTTGTGTVGLRAFIHVSMSIPGSQFRLRASLRESFNVIGGRLRLADLDGDGSDDIIVGSLDRVYVVLMGSL